MFSGTSETTAPAVSSSSNGWSFNDLFKDIGNTLEDIGKQTLQTTAVNLRTEIARRAAPAGTVVAGGGIEAFLPMLIVGALVLFLALKFLRR